MDTGIFDENRYFDVFVEYAKADVEDIMDQDQRSPIAARKMQRSTILPTVWLRVTAGRGLESSRPAISMPRATLQKYEIEEESNGKRRLYWRRHAGSCFLPENETQ